MAGRDFLAWSVELKLTGNGAKRDDSSWAIGRLLDEFHVDIGC